MFLSIAIYHIYSFLPYCKDEEIRQMIFQRGHQTLFSTSYECICIILYNKAMITIYSLN